ncbi:hypothetical protein [Longispora urticae]
MRSPSRLLAVFAALGTLVATAPPAYAAPTVRRTAVVLLDFRDSALREPDKVRATFAAQFFGPAPSVVSYYEEASDGRLRYAPVGDSGLFGPWTADLDATCDFTAIQRAGRAALAGHGVPADAYDQLAVVIPSQKNKCPWAGLASVPGNTALLMDYLSLTGTIHELGHNLGLSHERRLVCEPASVAACTEDGYSNRSPMGGGGTVGLSAPELIHTGWLPADRRVAVTRTGRWTLAALHAPRDRPGPRALEIAVGARKVVVEYRAKATIDTTTPGVYAYRVDNAKYADAPLLDATPGTKGADDTALAVGRPFTDAAAKVTVTVRAVGASGAEVEVRIGDAPSPSPSPTPSPSPSATPSPSASATVPASEDPAAAEPVTPTPRSQPVPAGNSFSWYAAGGALLLLTCAGALLLLLRRRR